jgi:hypothetical protein
MITILTLWINAHYKCDFAEAVFLAVFLDVLGMLCTCALVSELTFRFAG